jgi:hypothetical protein
MATAPVNNIAQLSGPGNSTNPGLIVPISEFAKVVSLVAMGAITTSGFHRNFASMNAPSSTGPFQVPASNSIHISGMLVAVNNTSPFGLEFGYGTAALGSQDTTTAPTGVVYYSTSSTYSGYKFDSGGTNIPKYWPINMSFPASSYPFFRADGGIDYRIMLSGILVPT